MKPSNRSDEEAKGLAQTTDSRVNHSGFPHDQGRGRQKRTGTGNRFTQTTIQEMTMTIHLEDGKINVKDVDMTEEGINDLANTLKASIQRPYQNEYEKRTTREFQPRPTDSTR